MKAIIYENYGPPEVLQITEMEKPQPKDNEVLIRVYATTVTSGDWRVRSLNLPKGFGFISRLVFGFNKPRKKILGSELAGEIEEVGRNVSKFKVGDQIFAFTDAKMGCSVEYKCLAETAGIVLKPKNLSYEEAAALSFGGTTALQFLNKAKIKKGDRILINGASGGVGTASIQIAKYLGGEVTAICSKANFPLVKTLGADYAIDYNKEDFTKNGKTYDVIMDIAGTAPFSRCKASLIKGGRLLLILGGLPQLLTAPWLSLFSGITVIAGPAIGKLQDLQLLGKLAESKKFKPVIDKSYPMEKIVEAHRHVDTGHKRGNVVITWKPAVKRKS